MDVSSIVARRSLEAFHRFPRRIQVRPRSICTNELVCVKCWLLRPSVRLVADVAISNFVVRSRKRR